jgi:hypothetical protein
LDRYSFLPVKYLTADSSGRGMPDNCPLHKFWKKTGVEKKKERYVPNNTIYWLISLDVRFLLVV